MFKLSLNLKVITFVLLIIHYAFNASITGSVKNKYTGTLIKGAIVKLTSTNSSVITDSLGKYSIESTDVGQEIAIVNQDNEPVLKGNRIQFSIAFPQKIKIEQFNLNGRKTYSLFSEQLKPGFYSYNLSTIANKAAGIYIIKITIGHNSRYFKSSALRSVPENNTISNSALLENNNVISGLSKQSILEVVVDTLVVSHSQYATCRQLVYEGKNIYNIFLDTLSRDASLCFLTRFTNDSTFWNVNSWSKWDYELDTFKFKSLTEFLDTVEYSADSVRYIISPCDMQATISINGQPIVNLDSGSTWFPLKNGNSFDTVTFTVTASNGIDSRSYKIITFRKPDTTVAVKEIKLSAGTPIRGFVADSKRYVATVDTSVSSLSIKITPKSRVATISVNNMSVPTDSFCLPIPITAGRNIVTAIITAQDGINKDTVPIVIARGLTLPSLYLTSDYTIQKISYPYLMTRNIVIDTNATLTINPGVSIFADSGKSIEVRGTLLIAGTSNDSIRISAIDTTRPWGQIKYLSIAKGSAYNDQNKYTDGCILRYCVIDNGGTEKFSYYESSSYVVSSEIALSVSHVHIRNCNSGGILMQNYSDNFSSVDSTVIEKVLDGLHIENYATGSCRLLNVIVRDNKFKGIYCITEDLNMAKCTVENNSEGVVAKNRKSVVSECTIKNNRQYGISIITEYGDLGLLTDCEISGNGFGNGTENDFIPQGGIIATSMKIRKCTIKNNVSRNKSHASAITANQSVIIDSTIITNNTSSSGTVRLAGYNDTLRYNLISNNKPTASTTDSADRAAIIIDQTDNSAIYNNNILNPQCKYEISNKAALQDVNCNALNNYWGTTTTEEIGQRIYDWYDDDAKSKVLFEPFLTSAEPAAPTLP